MVAVSKILIVCATIGSTIALPLAMSSRESKLAISGARNVQQLLMDIVALSEDTDGKMALSRRSKETIETPDSMWHPQGEERIRRSKESIRSAEIMWDPSDDDSTRLSE